VLPALNLDVDDDDLSISGRLLTPALDQFDKGQAAGKQYLR